MEHRQLVIIGGGPAGLTAAIYARRAGLDTLLFEPGLYGGMINTTAEVENYPGFKRIEGSTLGRSFREHAEMFCPEFRESRVKEVLLGGKSYDKIIRAETGDVNADTLIIAAGTLLARVGCKGEERFIGHGVSFCAVCDGSFYEGLPIAVIGGGNAAAEEAEYLTKFASKVYLIHRREEFRADSVVVERILANPKIEPVLGYVVDEIAGEDMVERVIVKNTKTLENLTLDVEGVFVFVGQRPDVEFLSGCVGIKRAGSGWIITDEKMETTYEGVFAAGDVREKFLRQAVTAAADGATAAMAAYEYVTNMNYLDSVLSGKSHAFALLISSVDPEHQVLARAVGEWKKSQKNAVSVIDLYRAGRVRDKLGIKELPSMAEISDGLPVRVLPVSSVKGVESFLKEAVR